MKTIVLSAVIYFCFIGFIKCQTLTVKMTGIESSKGEIRLAFFTTEEQFDDEKPKILKYVSKKGMQNGCLTVKFKDIPAGKYGVAMLDDENKNGEMDYIFFVPTEGFGFSDFYLSGMKKPHLSDFIFTFGKTDKTITIKLRYI